MLSLERLLARGGMVSLYVTFNGGAFTEPRFFESLAPLERRFPGSLEAYRATFRSKSDLMVIDPNNEFFKAMRGSGATLAPAAKPR